MQLAYREASPSLSYTSASRPIVSLDELSSLECAVIGATATTKAAEQMHLHPNTVRYRLQQIATKTGHDPRTFTGLVELVCILEITENDLQTQSPPR